MGKLFLSTGKFHPRLAFLTSLVRELECRKSRVKLEAKVCFSPAVLKWIE